MRKPYKSSKEDIIKSSTTNYGGTISNVIKEDKKGIEKTYIKEGYDYKKEVVQKTPENLENQILTQSNYKIESDRTAYNFENSYKEGPINDRVKSYRISEEKIPSYRQGEGPKRSILEKKNEDRNLKYSSKTYSYNERSNTNPNEGIRNIDSNYKSVLIDEKDNIDRVKSFRSSGLKNISSKGNEDIRQATPENIEYPESGYGKHDTEFISRGKAKSFILKKSKPRDLIYYENRQEDNNISKLIDRSPTDVLKDRGRAIKRSGNLEGRNEEKAIRPDTFSNKKLTTRTLENKYIRSRFAENMGEGDENFSINLSKTAMISGEKSLKLGASLGRYSSIKAINLFKKEKLNNTSLRSTLSRSTKDAIINFQGGNSDDFGVRTLVEVKDKTLQTTRLLTDRKGFLKTSITNFQLEGNQDLGIRTAIQTKDAAILGTRVVKGVYGTSKTTAKTAKRTYQLSKKAGQKIAYGFNKIAKIMSNPIVLKGIIGILLPLALIFMIVTTVTAIFPTSTAIASYPIAEVEFIQELQDNINAWNEDINNTIQSYYNTYDDVLIVNDDMVLVQLQDLLAILAVETQQDMDFKDMPLARDIYDMFYSFETEVEIYEEIESYYDSDLEEYVDIVVEKKRIIVDLINYTVEDVIDFLNYDDTNREWAITLAMADLTEMYPDLVVNNEVYYPSMPSLSPEEIEQYGGVFIHPTNGIGYISSYFGSRVDPITKERSFHSGLDIAGNDRSPIYAVKDGTVIFSGVNGSYGNCVIIDHGGGMVTLYAHCSSLAVTKGEYVLAGDNIARVGSTGRSTGPHLHLEVRINGKLINPLNFL